MEVKLDKRYALPVGAEQAWAVLADIRAVAACMPGAQITEQIDDTHFKGTVKTKVGPAVMQFAGEVELRASDAAARSLALFARGADRSGSSAAMSLAAHLETGETAGSSVLVGAATVTVSGKLAQFGSRLLVPVSDAMLAQFADNFRAAAAAVPAAAGEGGSDAAQAPVDDVAAEAAAEAAPGTALAGAAPAAADTPTAPAPAAAPASAQPALPASPPVKELDALALLWTVFKTWLARLFGRRHRPHGD